LAKQARHDALPCKKYPGLHATHDPFIIVKQLVNDAVPITHEPFTTEFGALHGEHKPVVALTTKPALHTIH